MDRILIALLLLCALSLPAMPVHATPPDRVLIFSKTAGFRHESIPVAVRTLNRLAEQAGMAADATEDANAFTAANLARYRVVIFASTTGNVLDPAQQRAMEGFIRAGGGFVGVHAAADTEYDWPWYGQLVGRASTTIRRGCSTAACSPSATAWPLALPGRCMTSSITTTAIRAARSRSSPRWTKACTKAAAWAPITRSPGTTPSAAAAWYTGLGHTEAIFDQPEFIAQLQRGLAYARGSSDAG